MSDFDEYIKNKYPSDYLLMTVRYPDQELSELYSDQFEVWQHQQAVIDEHTEVIKLQDADLRKYEKQIEQDADQILLAHPIVNSDDEMPSGITEIIIAKNRHGKKGVVRVMDRLDICRFASVRVEEQVGGGV